MMISAFLHIQVASEGYDKVLLGKEILPQLHWIHLFKIASDRLQGGVLYLGSLN